MAPAPGTRQGKVTMPRMARAARLRDRGLSWRAISQAMDEYEGSAPAPNTIRKYVLELGYPKSPRGRAHHNFKKVQ